jgi:hypothetical protein
VGPREYEIEATQLAAKRAAVTLRVFVGGPYINPQWVDLPDEQKTNNALVARFASKKHIESLGHSTSIGEDIKLEQIYKDHLD